jgi:hypothetical protein
VVDLLFIAILVAFFALMVGFVYLCERVVGKDEPVGTSPGPDTDTDTDTDSTTPQEVPA